STFCSTCRLWGPTAYSLLRLRHSNTTSVITKGLRRLSTGCAPGRIQGGKETHAQGCATDDNHIGPDQLGRQIADEVHIRAERSEERRVGKESRSGTKP